LNNFFRFLFLLILVLAVSHVSFTQGKFVENGEQSLLAHQSGIFAGSSTRRVIDLAGEWEYSSDDKKTWSHVKVPSAFDGVAKVWFRRTFNITPEMLDSFSCVLHCFGINYFCEITINDNFVGRHIGSSTSFSFPLEKHILELGSNNTIIIYVDNELNARNTVPLRQQVGGWKNYGGIFRDVFLLFSPKLNIDAVVTKDKVSSSMDNATVTLRATIANKGYAQLLQAKKINGRQLHQFLVEVYDKTTNLQVAKNTVSFSSGEDNHTQELDVSVNIDQIQLWSPESPALYEFRCAILSSMQESPEVIDECTFDHGIRTIEIHNTQFSVNGNAFQLKGIAWHEDNPNFGSALTYQAMEHDVILMKNAGVNLVRIAYRPVHPYVLNLCDKYGLFVFEEIPMLNVPHEILSNDNFQETAQAMTKEMIERDRNHPSIFAWGIGTDFETTNSDDCDVAHNLRNVIRTFDDRPVYFSSSQLVESSCQQEMDFAAFNALHFELQDAKKKLKEWTANFNEKPTVVISVGKEVEPGNRQGSSDPHSYEAQARAIQLLYDGVKDLKLGGIVIWSFSDYRGDRPSIAVHSGNPYLSSYGIVSEQREKRTAYDVLRILNNGEKVFALPVGTYSFSAPMIYVIFGLSVLIVFAYFYNRNRRFRDNINRSLFRTFNFFADIRDHRIISLGETILITVIIAITSSIVLSSLLVHFRDSVFSDVLISHLLISDSLKEFVAYTIWSPVKAILVFTILFMVEYVLIAALIKFFSLFIRTRVQFINAYQVTVWSMLPVIIFIPIGMILSRILETPFYIYPVAILILAIIVWIIQRLLKGISVIYDIFRSRIYFFGTIVVLAFLVATYSYYDYTQSTSAYLRYLLELTRR